MNNGILGFPAASSGGGGSASGLPAGILVPYAGTTAPSGWLFAAGQAVSRASYADLFAAIGTTYGAGDGSTTFNLPDMRGRVAAGRDDMGGSAANRLTSGGSGITGTTLGAAGGTETHTLTTAQLASHTHSESTGSAGANFAASNCGGSSAYGGTTGSTTGSAGSGNAHQNTQPTIIANYIVKT